MMTVAGCGSSDEDGALYEHGTDTPPGNTPPSGSDDCDDCDPLEEAEEILRLLNEQRGSDNFVEFFREMMFEHSEDPGGLLSFPDGYLFREGDMVSEFFEATTGLEIGEISGIVETMYGYHIILRLPIDYDTSPISPQGHSPTLRQLAAMEDFNLMRLQWSNALELEYSPEAEDIDLAVIFENGLDFESSFSGFSPDTVMITAGDFSLTWSHIFAFLFPIVSEVFQYHEASGVEVDWNEEAFDDSTWAELVLEYALEEAESILTLMYGIQQNNIVLSDDELQILNESIEDQIERHGSKEAFEEFYRDNFGFYNFEIFMELTSIEFGIGALVDSLYGDDGSDFPDVRVAEYAEANGYLMAMHILRMKHNHDH